jgi:2-methylaconitate cis-trans-isomerase PrpF
MDSPTLSGEPIAAAQVDLTARFLSNGQPHRALPLTASLCTAVAARIDGSLVAEALAPGGGDQVRIGMPSGILTVGADVGQEAGGHWVARSGAFYRTARRLFDGRIYVPR